MMTSVQDAPTEQLPACPLCGGGSWKSLPLPGRWIGREVFRDLDGQIGLVKCRGCQLVFINPRPSQEKLSAFYSGDTYTCHEATGSASAGAKADFLLGQISKSLPAEVPRTLLDYGAGGGGFLSHAGDMGWEVKGFEPGRRGLESCRQAGLDVTDRTEDLPEESFGLITLHHVFEHLANPIEVLDSLRRFLAPEGRLYIEVPNARSMRARLAMPFLSRRFRVDERYRAYPIHLMYYSDRTLREMLETAGWHVERTLTIGLGLDEFRVHPDISRKPTAPTNNSSRPASSSPPKRRFRHTIRDAFLGMGLGENLAAIASPTGGKA